MQVASGNTNDFIWRSMIASHEENGDAIDSTIDKQLFWKLCYGVCDAVGDAVSDTVGDAFGDATNDLNLWCKWTKNSPKEWLRRQVMVTIFLLRMRFRM